MVVKNVEGKKYYYEIVNNTLTTQEKKTSHAINSLAKIQGIISSGATGKMTPESLMGAAKEIKEGFDAKYNKANRIFLKIFGGDAKKAEVDRLYAEILDGQIQGVSSEIELIAASISDEENSSTFDASYDILVESDIPTLFGLKTYLEESLTKGLSLSEMPGEKLLQVLYVIQKNNLSCPNFLKQLEKHCKFTDDRIKTLASNILIDASRKEQIPLMECLLKLGAPANNINKKQLLRTTALIVAVSAGKVKSVELLLKHGADVGLPNFGYATPLSLVEGTKKIKHKTEIKALLESSKGLDKGKQALCKELNKFCHANKANHRELINILESLSADIRDPVDYTDQLAIYNPDSFLKMIELLQDKTTEYPLLRNLFMDNLHKIPVISKENVNFFAEALQKAISNNKPNRIPLLCQVRFENQAERQEVLNNALLNACQLGNFYIAKQLIENGGNLSAKDSEGNTPLRFAAKFNNKAFAKFLFSYAQESSNLEVTLSALIAQKIANPKPGEETVINKFIDNVARNYLDDQTV